VSLYGIGPGVTIWGSTLCSRHGCAEPATLTIDRWPFCLEHGDEEVERIVAIELLGIERVLAELPSEEGERRELLHRYRQREARWQAEQAERKR
jgi:hypothetical protein